MDINSINIANLAYIGDAVYELEIRNFLIKKNKKVNELKELSTSYVSGNAQSLILDYLIDNKYLSENEIDLVKRARNYKSKSKPKHTLIKDYKKATALECLFGYLYIYNDKDRIEKLIKIITELR